jgi:hypothetical protein
MNRRQLFLPTLALFIFGLGHQNIGWAQAGGAGVGPPAATGQYAPVIQPQLTILVQNVDQTTAQNTSQIADARKALISQFFALPASSQDAYTADLAKMLMDVLTNPAGPPPVRTRLEFAIIADVIGPSTHRLVFVPLVTQLLGDSADPVVYWAEKAAGQIFADALTYAPTGVAGTSALVQQIIASIGPNGHATTPMAASIADSALKSVILFGIPGAQNIPPAGLSAQVDYIMDVKQARINLYLTGVPASPNSDSFASTVVLDPQKWPTFNPAQQKRAVQEASDLIGVIGQRYGQGGAQNSDMLKGMKHEADTLQILATQSFPTAQLTTALAAVHGLNVGSLPTVVNTAGQNVYVALASNPKFATLNPQPTVQSQAAPAASTLSPTAASGSK